MIWSRSRSDLDHHYDLKWSDLIWSRSLFYETILIWSRSLKKVIVNFSVGPIFWFKLSARLCLFFVGSCIFCQCLVCSGSRRVHDFKSANCDQFSSPSRQTNKKDTFSRSDQQPRIWWAPYCQISRCYHQWCQRRRKYLLFVYDK